MAEKTFHAAAVKRKYNEQQHHLYVEDIPQKVRWVTTKFHDKGELQLIYRQGGSVVLIL